METSNDRRQKLPIRSRDVKVSMSPLVPTPSPDANLQTRPHSTAVMSSLDEPAPMSTAQIPSTHPTFRRHPARQAASGAHYSLSAKWSSIEEYLTESNASSESEVDGDKHRPGDRKRGVRRVYSEEDSDSDEYTIGYRYTNGRRTVGIGQRLGANDKEQLRRKRRRLEKLEKADLEVIHGEKPKARKGGLLGRRGKLQEMTRIEAGRLVEYLLGKTDWREAASHVRGDLIKKEPMESANVQKAFKLSEKMLSCCRKPMGPDGLRAHWKDTLSKKIVEQYVD